MLEVTALPQSTAAVERTFSKISNSKTKFRNALSVRTVEQSLEQAIAFRRILMLMTNWLVCIPRQEVHTWKDIMQSKEVQLRTWKI